MRPNVKQEYNRTMDNLRFSPEAKAAMVDALMAQSKEIPMKKHTTKRFLFVALAAAMVLVMLTGAAVYTRWSRSAQNQYTPSQEIKEQAEKSGLSVILEAPAKETNSNEIVSATDQGITITAVQSIIDGYRGEITFRIEGFDLPEGRYPHVWPVITIDGDEHFFGSLSGHFFDGTTYNDAGEWVYTDTGLPVEMDATGEYPSAVLKPVAKDGSIEYTSTFSFQKTPFSVDGKEIVVTFDGIGVQSEQKAGMPTYLVEGSWELRWTLRSASDAISLTPNAPVGDNGVTLLTAQIGQKTIVATFQLQEYWTGHEVMDSFPEAIQGVRMKDGSEYYCIPSTTGYRAKDGSKWASPDDESYKDMTKTVYYMEYSMFDTILDPSQAESFLFHKGWEYDSSGQPVKQIFDYLPIG